MGFVYSTKMNRNFKFKQYQNPMIIPMTIFGIKFKKIIYQEISEWRIK